MHGHLNVKMSLSVGTALFVKIRIIFHVFAGLLNRYFSGQL